MSNTARTNDATRVTGRRISTETKASVKTTELIAYVVATIAVITLPRSPTTSRPRSAGSTSPC